MFFKKKKKLPKLTVPQDSMCQRAQTAFDESIKNFNGSLKAELIALQERLKKTSDYSKWKKSFDKIYEREKDGKNTLALQCYNLKLFNS
jgi:hypothetical protein